MKKRIEELIAALGVSGREFCASIGKSNSWNRSIQKTIGADVMGTILRTYPQINIYWLLYGEGEMFSASAQELLSEKSPNYHLNNNYQSICNDMNGYIRELREENKQLRETVLELMHKNETLMIENAQLIAKSTAEQSITDH